MTSLSITLAALAIVVAQAAGSVLQPEKAVDPQAFAALTAPEKSAVLREFGIGSRPWNDQAREILRLAMQDPAVRVRRDGLSTVSAIIYRLSAERHTGSPAKGASFAQMRALRPEVVSALSDDDARVRVLAVDAIGYLEHDPAKGPEEVDLSPPTVAVLSEVFARDTDPKVRANVMRALAVIGNARLQKAHASPEVDALVLRALDDSDTAVREWAVRAVFRSKPAIPKAVGMLKDPSPEVRAAVASLFAMLREEGLPYEASLAQALEREKDSRVRGTLSIALKGLAQIKRQ